MSVKTAVLAILVGVSYAGGISVLPQMAKINIEIPILGAVAASSLWAVVSFVLAMLFLISEFVDERRMKASKMA